MPVAIANWVAVGALLYLALGAGFAVLTHLRGIDRHDPSVTGGTVGFRLLITAGLVGLWPLLIGRPLVNRERSAHDEPLGTPAPAWRRQPAAVLWMSLLALAVLAAGWLSRPGAAAWSGG